MNVIIAEKPSQGKDIANAISKNFDSQNGYMQNGDYIITWCFGHLVEIDDGAFSNGKWDIESLPVYPERFDYKISKGKEKQFNVIKNILQKNINEKIIIATDPGREGELIARLVMIQAGVKSFNNVFRLWSNALTPEKINSNLQNLAPAKDYDYLFFSGLARQHADWIVGINATRFVSVKAGSLWTVGRVQTPTLKLIVDRYLENINFKPEEYFELQGEFVANNEIYKGLLIIDRIFQKDKAHNILQDLNNCKKAVVKSVEKTDKQQNAPALHSTTSLQKEANNIFGYTANKTLEIAQQLYEKYKCSSYPRTESNHLSENDRDFAFGCLKKLDEYEQYKNVINKNIETVGKKIFDDAKLTDHHAIIPLKEPGDLPDELSNVFMLIKRRFLANFLDVYKYQVTKIITAVNDYDFESKGNTPLQKGWRVLFEKEEKDNEDNITLPGVVENMAVDINGFQCLEKYTKPPALLSQGDLVDSAMKKYGLGTGATRAGIIETLYKRDYIKTQKKKVIPTPKGLELIEKIKDKKISSPDMTAQWEEKLENNTRNKNDYRVFLDQQKNFIKNMIEDMADVEFEKKASEKKIKFVKDLAKMKKIAVDNDKLNDDQYLDKIIEENKDKKISLGKCKCDGDIQETKMAYNCSKCDAVIWKKTIGKKIDEKLAVKLLSGQEVFVKGLKSKAGKKFDAKLKYSHEKKKIDLLFD